MRDVPRGQIAEEKITKRGTPLIESVFDFAWLYQTVTL